MDSLNVVVIYHPNCKASTDFLIHVSKLTEADLEYINIKEDKIETDINVDVVPFIIINNNPSGIYKGKAAFDKVTELISTAKKPKQKETNSLKFGKTVTFIESDSNKGKEKIDLSKK